MANGINAAKKQLGILREVGILLPTLVQISCWLWEQNFVCQLADFAWQELLTLSAVPLMSWC